MSQATYLAVWEEEAAKLQELVKIDKQAVTRSPYFNLQETKKILGNLFVRYSMVANRLCEAADAVTEPISSEKIRKLYELTVSRVLHLADDLTRLLAAELITLDDIFIQHETTPYDIQLRIPQYFLAERMEAIERRKRLFEKVRISMSQYEEEENEAKNKSNQIIQQNKELLFLRKSNAESKKMSINSTKTRDTLKSGSHSRIGSNDSNNISLADSKMAKNNIEGEEINSQIIRDIDAQKINLEQLESNKKTMREKSQKIEDNLRRNLKDSLVEAIEDELFEWMTDTFNEMEGFLPYPPENAVCITGETYGIPKKVQKQFKEKFVTPANVPKGDFERYFANVPRLAGSALIPAKCWVSPEEWKIVQEMLKEKKKDDGKVEKKVNNNKINENPQGFSLNNTEFFTVLELILHKQSINKTEKSNIEHNAFTDVGLEVRKEVDAGMRNELEILQDALYKDKYPKKKRKKGKNKGKVKKKKAKKDITGAMTTEECAEELVKNKILREVPEEYLSNFVGDRSWAELPEIANGELLDFLINRCILPLSSAGLHHLGPLTRSICLLGPRDSGKRYLVNLVAHAVGATIFDLSPPTTANIYPGQKGLKMLTALLQRMTRELQPSIIFIEHIEKIFYSKVPKADKNLNPKKLQGTLTKLVKAIRAQDRVLLIATSSQPWLGKRSKMIKTCERFIFVPNSHYGTHVEIWKRFLLEKVDSKQRTALAKMSSQLGLTYSKIGEAVNSSNLNKLTEENSQEEEQICKMILNRLVQIPCGDTKHVKKMDGYLAKTPLDVSKPEFDQMDSKKVKK